MASQSDNGHDAGGTLGPEQRGGDGSRVVPPNPAGLPTDLARVGTIPASHSVVDAALRMVTALARETVEGAGGVSVSLQRHGRLMTVASTDETILGMDHHQYDTGEGPCVDAATEGRWFHAESLPKETRWPTFIPLAMEQGIASILSSPLKVADRSLGALNIYARAEHAFGTREQELAALFAAQASGILADAGADVADEQLAERIAIALQDRQMIAHAEGILMGRDGLTAEDASGVLIHAARAAGTSLVEHASAVVRAARRESAE